MNVKLSRRRLLGGASIAAAGVALAACTGLMGPPRVAYSEAELNQMLGRRFPIEKRVLQALDLSLANPRLTLRPDAGRLSTEFDVLVGDRLFGHSWRGHLALDYGLRLERSDNSLRFDDPRVTRFALDQGGSAQAERIGALAIERLLADTVIHRLKPEQVARLTQAGYELGEVRVTAHGVEINARARR